jgi:sugar phosphate isomerase/epimerase
MLVALKSFRDYFKALESSRKTLEELNPLSTDIKLCVENMPVKGHFGNLTKELPIEARDLLYLVDNLDNIGIAFDIAHANNVENALEFYDRVKESGKILNVHLRDNDGKLDSHLPLGKGNIDFRKFLEKLKQENYQGYFSIELDTWPEPPEPMEKHERINALSYLRNLDLQSVKEKNI